MRLLLKSIKSSVDRTPHHSRWVDQKLDDEQRKDVVILKRFLSAGGIYGSSKKVEVSQVIFVKFLSHTMAVLRN